MYGVLFPKKMVTIYFLVLYNIIMERKIQTTQEVNTEEFDRLLLKRVNLEDFEKNGCSGNIHGWRDSYHNHYMIYSQRQKDGKFHGYIKNRRTGKIVLKLARKQKKAIRTLFFKRIDRANTRFDKAQKGRQERKDQREALKPKLTVKEKQAQYCQKHLTRLQANVARNEAKIRRSNTRIKTDKRKIKYYLKRLDNL